MDDGVMKKRSVPAAAIAIDTFIGGGVVRVAADASVADVAKAIADKNVGAVVVGDEERPTALVSERDVVRIVAGGAGSGCDARPRYRQGQHPAGVV